MKNNANLLFSIFSCVVLFFSYDTEAAPIEVGQVTNIGILPTPLNPFGGVYSGTNNLPQSGVLDGDTLTLNLSITANITIQGQSYSAFITTTDIFTGSWSDGYFVITGGNSTVTSCMETNFPLSMSLCGTGEPLSTVGLTTPLAIDQPKSSDLPSGFSPTGTSYILAHIDTLVLGYVMTPVTPVPVPSSIWLFCSGLGSIRLLRKRI